MLMRCHEVSAENARHVHIELNYDRNELSSQQLYYIQIILTWDFKLLYSWDGPAYKFKNMLTAIY